MRYSDHRDLLDLAVSGGVYSRTSDENPPFPIRKYKEYIWQNVEVSMLPS